MHAIAASQVFDGSTVHKDAAVVIDGASIAAIVTRSELPTAMEVHELPEGIWLAPGFIDIQVNGGGDVLFNDNPTADGVRAIVAAHRKSGTTALLPTLISDTQEKMLAALATIEALAASEPGVLGIHLEGPFLSPEKRGVHDARALRHPSETDFAAIAGARAGVTLVTLAPEQVPDGFIRRLTAAGMRIALGHSMATYAQTRAAMAEGVTGFTHLFNAMRPLATREPGPIAAALECSDAYYGLIVDGIHVAPAMLRLALRGAGKPILVSDAMPPVGGTKSSFMLGAETITLRDGRCAKADGTLAGAYLDMGAAVRNCLRWADVPLTDALRFSATHPADFLGLGHTLGRLAPGFRADLVAFNPSSIEVLDSWVAGANTHANARRLTGQP